LPPPPPLPVPRHQLPTANIYCTLFSVIITITIISIIIYIIIIIIKPECSQKVYLFDAINFDYIQSNKSFLTFRIAFEFNGLVAELDCN